MTKKAYPNQTVWQVRNSYFGMYVHFPYCFQKCDYCDFYSEGIGKDHASTEQELFESYKKEILFRKSTISSLFEKKLDTIFLGGGTPSKAKPESWKDLLTFIRSEFDVSEDAEISIEVNPEDFHLELLHNYKDMGINRVNLGVQTLNAEGLQFLGRHYDVERYSQIKETLSKSPIHRVGIDLMYGIPNVPDFSFDSDLNEFLRLNLPHLSLYSLTLERGTQYSRDVKSKSKSVPNEANQTRILKVLPDWMEKNGYQWYEVSNYSKPGFESKHNLKYWTYEPYMGIGPGAHGFLDGKRYGNPRNTNLYIRKPLDAKMETADPKTELGLTLFRLFAPFDYQSFFKTHLDEKTQTHYLNTILSFEERGFATLTNGSFQWKKEALLTLDDLILEIVSA
ncbi:radical SAM family heme chaperone HemW [Leptospira sp. 96542]|nr:radical SAM family heme chaperone HemW [Leptospira sp. 96542]